ncbi:MAG: purine and other phosphorylase-like protein, family 1 [Steroidobacteraceae bacterium]
MALASEARALGPSKPRGGDPPLSELALLGEGSLLALSGIGRAAATVAAQALVDAGVTALMSFGMAGGLDPKLLPGSVVIPYELLSSDGARYAACRVWRDQVGAAVSAVCAVTDGNLLSSSHALATPADKAAAFRNTGAAAVDMESAAVAQIAAKHNLPFIAVRVIVDTAADALPRAVVAASRAGRVQFARLIGGLIVAPREIAALVRLAQRYRIAMRSLRTIGVQLT